VSCGRREWYDRGMRREETIKVGVVVVIDDPGFEDGAGI
jgi:hypothetical protein